MVTLMYTFRVLIYQRVPYVTNIYKDFLLYILVPYIAKKS